MNARPRPAGDRPDDRDGCPWRDSAHSFVLGLLGSSEDAAYREHLLEGCGACGAELVEARRQIADLDQALARLDPAASRARALRAKALADLGPAPAAPRRTPFAHLFDQARAGVHVPSSLPGVSLVFDSEQGWQETPVPGVSFKTLFEDRARRYATALVRMGPGSSYPSHRHAGTEECYVIAGEVELAEHRFGPGDYLVSEPGSIHPPHRTREGCVLLIVSSQDDQLLDDGSDQ